MKKIMILLLGILLILTSCAPRSEDDDNEVLKNEKDAKQQETSLVPSNTLSKKNYKMPIPYRTSEARGVILNQLGNRLDIDEMEEGLRRHSKSVFDPEKYLFEEGQYLDEDTVYDWLGRKPTKKQLEERKNKYRNDKDLDSDAEVEDSTVIKGNLNPKIESFTDEEREENPEEVKQAEEESPKYLSHILEQNFLRRNDDDTTSLAGVSIGLALKSVYQFQIKTGGPDYYKDIPDKKILEKGKEIAQEVLERLRKMDGLEEVPIMIALYREESQDSPVPGNYIAKTNIGSSDMSIKKWEAIDEDYVLFPSSEAKDDHFEEHQVIEDFGVKIADYFPNYVGVMGEGFYDGDELKKLTLKIPLDFNGKSEIIAFTQYIYGLVQDMFPVGYNLEIQIKSSDKLESLIYREANEEKSTVHVFH